jgi:hypothetical protein
MHDVDVALTTGNKKVTITFNNDAFDSDTGSDRNLYIDAVEVYRDDELVTVIEGESFESTAGFSQTIDAEGNVMGAVENIDIDGAWTPAAWTMGGFGFVAFHVDIPTTGNYRFRIIAWGSEFSDGVPANMTATISALDFSEETAGSQALKAQLQHLHYLMLGEKRAASDPEIEAAYQLLVETWQDRKTHTGNDRAWNDPSEECLFPRGISQADWESGLGSDPFKMIYAWTSVMHFYLTHFDYLHE